jgi:hypothetical protein
VLLVTASKSAQDGSSDNSFVKWLATATGQRMLCAAGDGFSTCPVSSVWQQAAAEQPSAGQPPYLQLADEHAGQHCVQLPC